TARRSPRAATKLASAAPHALGERRAASSGQYPPASAAATHTPRAGDPFGGYGSAGEVGTHDGADFLAAGFLAIALVSPSDPGGSGCGPWHAIRVPGWRSPTRRSSGP